MNKNINKPKGPWSHRFGIKFFTVIFAILIYWLLGFLVNDIRTIRSPNYSKVENKYVDHSLVVKLHKIEKQISDVKYTLGVKRKKQSIVGVGINNLEKTIFQLLELQKLSLEKNLTFSEKEQNAFAQSINHFLTNQKQYQQINEEIASLTETENTLNLEKRSLEEKLQKQRAPAQAEYNKILKKHKQKLAFYQLLMLIPLLLIAVFLVLKFKNSIYSSIYFGFLATTLLKVSMVIHRYFPSKFFKYILIIALIGVVLRLLIYFIRSISSPKINALIKQYRQAYTLFLCPVCEHPIRRGPMKFLFWNRKTIKKLSIGGTNNYDDSPYVCPSCSTNLFEECSKCKKTRNSLLPSCEHCGDIKEISN